MTELSRIHAAPPARQETRLRSVAVQLEAGFLAEMLKTAGVGKPPSTFSGGAGEDHLASFLVDEHARALAERGGIGLAEAIFDAIKDR